MRADALPIPLLFEAAAGEATSFISRAAGYVAQLDAASFTVALPSLAERLTAEFVASDPGAVLRGERRSKAIVREYVGSDPAAWRPSIAAYHALRVRGLYAGVDLVYTAHGRRVGYELHVAPGAELSAVVLAFRSPHGADLRLDGDGNALIRLPGATVVHSAPVMYQSVREGAESVCVPVAGSFWVAGDTLRLRAAAYDASLPLVVDPIVYVSYWGGGTNDTTEAAIVRGRHTTVGARAHWLRCRASPTTGRTGTGCAATPTPTTSPR